MRSLGPLRRSGAKVDFAPNVYTTSGGSELSASSLRLDGRRLQIRHPRMRRSGELVRDGLLRLTRLGRGRGRSGRRLESFSAAMFALYNAVYWNRGSASICENIFAGLTPGLFGRKMPRLGDGADVLAMISSEEEFITMARKSFK